MRKHLWNWKEVPVLRVLLPFMGGILLACHINLEQSWAYIFLGILVLSYTYLHFRPLSFRFRWLAPLTLYLSFFVLGFQLYLDKNESRQESHFQSKVQYQNEINGIISSAVEWGKHIKFELDVQAIKVDHKWNSSSGTLLVYALADDPGLDLQYGDAIRLNARIRAIEAPKNPDAFDFKRYAFFKNIHHQTFTALQDIQLLNRHNGNPVVSAALAQRKRFQSILAKRISSKNELAVANALILGNKNYLSDDIKNEYADTGSMHILAVSGLHVGFVFMLVNFLLQRMPYRAWYWKWLKLLIVLASIWGFALITGASTSVIRASTMFSFFQIGMILRRGSSIYNTIALVALLMLIYNPYYLMDVGFQLSFLAIIGVIYFYQKIYILWMIEHKWGDYFWKLLAVAIAAQLGTLPLSLFYFHQFPTYFLLSGLAVVPLASFILGTGMALFAFDALPWIGDIIGYILHWIIYLLNAIIHGIYLLPLSSLEGIWIGIFAVFLLYGFIYSISFAIRFKQKKWLWVSIIFLGILSVQNLYQSYVQSQQKGVTIYQSGKESLGDFHYQKKIICLKTPTLSLKKEANISTNNRIKKGLHLHQNTPIKSGLLTLSDRSLILIHQNQMPPAFPVSEIDILWLSDSDAIDLDVLLEKVHPKLIVIDDYLDKKMLNTWEVILKNKSIKSYFIQEHGAYQIDW